MQEQPGHLRLVTADTDCRVPGVHWAIYLRFSEVTVIIIPILQRRKLKFGEVK